MVIVRNLLSVLAVLGLILAPVGRPAVALPTKADAAMHDHVAMADMPCCPDEGPASCAKDCPLMALCAGGTMLYPPTETALSAPHTLGRLNLAANDPDLAGQVYGPPPRPPKF